jgi:hypothetical protein
MEFTLKENQFQHYGQKHHTESPLRTTKLMLQTEVTAFYVEANAAQGNLLWGVLIQQREIDD